MCTERSFRIVRYLILCEVEGRELPVSESKAVSGQNRTVAMDEDRLDTQELSNLAGMLTTCTTETGQSTFPHHRQCLFACDPDDSGGGVMRYVHVSRRCVAPRLRQSTNRSTHRLICYLDESVPQQSRESWNGDDRKEMSVRTRRQSHPNPTSSPRSVQYSH